MATYFPIDAGVEFDCVNSDLIGFDWLAGTADFVIPQDSRRALRVRFALVGVSRMLDEMTLSIETAPGVDRGLVPHHFAYRVEGSLFSDSAAARLWSEIFGPASHYCFVTGGGCLDVLTAVPPEFAVIPR
ncbi:hypothetical protein [Brevundimonas sp. NIBR11]|uniref:hypothetical protein n=1 Tax=Brevundimonas sp. NIBR11 TaxID=3015999 RepID=UPI0022F11346|nr:hypothetical protein [Brevundimonas sp. NIBR11]WGM32903.1 hypothetical protein KKHFBJBL_03159 [Brevundimonas sp. NIBR11]